MNRKPKLKLSTIDTTVEVIGLLLVLTIWSLILVYFSNLPDTIPIHFNGSGKADRFGAKAALWNLPIVATIIYLVLTVLNIFLPKIISLSNLPEEKVLLQITLITRLLRYLKLIIMVVFGTIAFKTIQSIHEQNFSLGTWFLPLILTLIFIPLIYFLVKIVKPKQL